MTNIIWLLVFWIMQVIAQVLFKYGTLYPSKWTLFFILGNVFGASSIWFLMLLYKSMNMNVALALGAGGGFLACQIGVAIIFHSRLSLTQMVGMLGIAVCMALVASGGVTE